MTSIRAHSNRRSDRASHRAAFARRTVARGSKMSARASTTPAIARRVAGARSRVVEKSAAGRGRAAAGTRAVAERA